MAGGTKTETRSFGERTAERLHLPAELSGAPLVELCGRSQLRMEHHRGILSYGETEIHISGGGLVVTVRGSGLTLLSMDSDRLMIGGVIDAVELN